VLAGNPVGLRSAYALESILDEAIFTVGPLITTTLALHLALPAPLILAATLTVVGVGLLAPQRATQPPATARSVDAHRSAIRMPGMAVVSCIAIGIGSVFGSYEVSTVAFASSLGQEAWSGPLLAIWALASGLAGLWYGSRQWTSPLPRQLAAFAGLLFLALLPAPFVPTVPLLVLVTVVSGAAVAPTLIAIFSLVERLVPGPQLTESLTWANSGLAVGFSAGVSIAGAIIDRAGPSWSFVLSISSAALAAILAAAFTRRLQQAERPVTAHAPATARNVDLLPGPQPGAFVDPAE
jgi:predicted MFS family arabinose efflux permease